MITVYDIIYSRHFFTPFFLYMRFEHDRNTLLNGSFSVLRYTADDLTVSREVICFSGVVFNAGRSYRINRVS